MNNDMSLFRTLPVELLDRIVSFIDSPKSLAALNQTCRFFRNVTEKTLYGSVLISNESGPSFANTISARPEYKALVKEIHVDCDIKKDKDRYDASACTYAPVYAEFENLEVLNLRSGYWHWDDFVDDDPERVMWETDQKKLAGLFDQAGLSKPLEERIWTKLRSCTLDFWEMNGQGWYLTFEPAIFLVGALEQLTIRGCRFHDRDGVELLKSPYCGQTPLRKLALERCYIYHPALFKFLSAPKALTHLTLKHEPNLWHTEIGVQPSTSNRAEDYMVAFRLHQHSLEFLHMNDDMCSEFEGGTFDLSDFTQLRLVEYGQVGSGEFGIKLAAGVESVYLESW